MKISSNWLKEHIELGLSVPELSAALLKIGFEIAGVAFRPLANALDVLGRWLAGIFECVVQLHERSLLANLAEGS